MEITDNKIKHQFETVIDGYTARAEYILSSSKIIITHTEIPKQLEGKGIGSELMEEVFKKIETMNVKLIPLCPFAAQYIKRHPKWEKLLDDNINIS